MLGNAATQAPQARRAEEEREAHGDPTASKSASLKRSMACARARSGTVRNRAGCSPSNASTQPVHAQSRRRSMRSTTCRCAGPIASPHTSQRAPSRARLARRMRSCEALERRELHHERPPRRRLVAGTSPSARAGGAPSTWTPASSGASPLDGARDDVRRGRASPSSRRRAASRRRLPRPPRRAEPRAGPPREGVRARARGGDRAPPGWRSWRSKRLETNLVSGKLLVEVGRLRAAARACSSMRPRPSP